MSELKNLKPDVLKILWDFFVSRLGIGITSLIFVLVAGAIFLLDKYEGAREASRLIRHDYKALFSTPPTIKSGDFVVGVHFYGEEVTFDPIANDLRRRFWTNPYVNVLNVRSAEETVYADYYAED